jgi:hypothetical protein
MLCMSRRDFGLGGLRGEPVGVFLLGDIALPTCIPTLITSRETELEISIDVHTLGWERIGGVDGFMAQVDIASKRFFGHIVGIGYFAWR